MEQFLFELEAYASALKISPSTVIQRAGVGSGSTWRKWQSRKSSPTLITVDKLKDYMAQNPPEEAAA